ncbi:hypothetical protein EDC04DRAFT_2889440 [Pisolithus marmoratus]|nr:hypothetical protein EDC04DRAFT_2889440 [Pisolithus marmoratus]
MNADNQGGRTEGPRILVLCFDGTRGKFDGDNTNVVKFFGLLRRDMWNKQRCYYQPGVGTYFEPGVVSPLFSWGAKILDEAIAWYLQTHVMDGYKFLMANYREGDKICLFGFSRGAYTARALAGMLAKVGLLSRDNMQSVTFAYEYYKRTDEEGKRLARRFKKKFCHEVHIEFVGVWDTVQSTGLVMGKSLPFTGSNDFIKTFRQALALDERRAKYRPKLCRQPSKEQKSNLARKAKSRASHLPHCEHQTPPGDDKPVANGTSESDEEQAINVREVWFAGGHGDIGGGNVKDEVTNSLSQITLRWMVEEVIESECGILFNKEGLRDLGIPVSPQAGMNGAAPVAPGVEQGDVKDAAPTSDSHSGPSSPTGTADAELKHATAKLFDYLDFKYDPERRPRITWAWWLLEIIPLPSISKGQDGKWHKKWSIHLGKGRELPPQAQLHRTVRMRMEHAPSKYKPRPKCKYDEIDWFEPKENIIYSEV